MKKLLVFGGTFNPIHNGHNDLLSSALEQIKPDLTLVIPNYDSPHKQSNISNPEIHKKNMVNLFLKDFSTLNVKLDDFEINKKEKSYTIDTLNYLRKKYQDYEIYLLLGSDSLIEFKKWKSYEQIISIVKKLVIGRRRMSTSKYKQVSDFIHEYSHKITILKDFKMSNISATEIRNHKVKETDLNPYVLEYINDQGLYAIDRIKKHLKSEKRVSHSLRVAYYAEQLCKNHNLSNEITKKAKVAGLYHDIAKDYDQTTTEMYYYEMLNYKKEIPWKTMHAYVGAYLLEKDFLFWDKDVLNAIRRHTLPFEFFDTEPTTLDKIIFLADKLEMNRTNEDVCNEDIEYYRNLSFKNIDQAFLELIECLKNAKHK